MRRGHRRRIHVLRRSCVGSLAKEAPGGCWCTDIRRRCGLGSGIGGVVHKGRQLGGGGGYARGGLRGLGWFLRERRGRGLRHFG